MENTPNSENKTPLFFREPARDSPCLGLGFRNDCIRGGGGHTELNSVHTRCIVKKEDLQGVFVKIGEFIKYKGFLVEFLQNRRS